MFFQHLRQRLGTTLAALALIAVGGCTGYPTIAFSSFDVSSGYGYHRSYGPPVIAGWHSNHWRNGRGGGHSWYGHRHGWHGGSWHHRHGSGAGLHRH
jgi:hypothetical protein